MSDIIKKIVLDLGKKQVELTPEQAKKLKAALDEMFGERVVREVYPNDYWRWYPYWSYDKVDRTPTVTWGCQTTNGCSASYSDNTMTMKVA